MKDEPFDAIASDGFVASRMPFYAALYPRIRQRAREKGYALALHGSLTKDLDLIAVPWTVDAASEDDLVRALVEEAGGYIGQRSGQSKGHGRRCWTIHLGGFAGYIDLSVMQRVVEDPLGWPELPMFHTQTDTEHGNCWQTAVACLLRVQPHELPCQVSIEKAYAAQHEHRDGYQVALNSYLEKHHGKMYSELYDYQYGGIRHMGFHLMVGPTERTPTNGGVWHVVVAHNGRLVWDPHPSRRGLTKPDPLAHQIRWGVLSPLPEHIRALRENQRRGGHAEYECRCPACGGPSKPIEEGG